MVAGKFGDQDAYASLSVAGANCVLKNRQLSATTAAACTVTAESSGYLVTQTFNFIQPVDQAPLSLTNTSFTTSYLGSFSLSASGGSGNGPVSYYADGCTLGEIRFGMSTVTTSYNNPSTLKTRGPSTCTVWASKAASAGYKAVSSAATKFTFTPLAPESLFIQYQVAGGAKAESMALGEGASLGTVDSSGRAVSSTRFSVSGANCTLRGGGFVTANSATTCVVTAARDGYEIKKHGCFNDGECREDWWQYGPSTSAPVSFVFDYRDQAPLFIYNPVTTTTAPFVYLISMGGSGIGATTYSVTGESCSLSLDASRNSILNATAPATCVVTATKAASPIGYRSAVNSPPKTFYFKKP